MASFYFMLNENEKGFFHLSNALRQNFKKEILSKNYFQ
ncbi:hypothetical protein FPS14_contig00003-0013 [Flavobacterium psychrophilum]|nr:hypothetical protein FPS14_contig00003-0013 [Flavobacterium psychrophilum]